MGKELIKRNLIIAAYQSFIKSQLNLLDVSTKNSIGSTTDSYLKVAAGITDHAKINDLTQSPERVVMSGDIITILPENPSANEKELATDLTNETDLALKRLKIADPTISGISVPIATIMLRGHEDAKRLMPRVPRLAGVISRTIPPFFNTFNIEASKFAEKIYGDEIGKKISLFSYMHECGHLVYSQNRSAKLKDSLCNTSVNQQVADLAIVSSILDPMLNDEIYWELWANRLPNENPNIYIDGLPIFPYWVAKQSINRSFDSKKIIEQGGFDNFSGQFTSHYPKPNEGLDYPFVMDPADAQEYLTVTDYLSNNKNPKFYWL